MLLAGGRGWKSPEDYGDNRNFYLFNGLDCWTISPGRLLTNDLVHILVLGKRGELGDRSSSLTTVGVRPVLSLLPTTTFVSGNGMSAMPYIITS